MKTLIITVSILSFASCVFAQTPTAPRKQGKKLTVIESKIAETDLEAKRLIDDEQMKSKQLKEYLYELMKGDTKYQQLLVTKTEATSKKQSYIATKDAAYNSLLIQTKNSKSKSVEKREAKEAMKEKKRQERISKSKMKRNK